MSRPNSFKRTSSENEIFQNIISLLKYKNFNPSKEEDIIFFFIFIKFIESFMKINLPAKTNMLN